MISESDLEHSCLSWFAELGYEVLDPDHLEPNSVYDERSDLADVILKGRLVAALERLNQDAPPEALDEAVRRILRHDAPTLEQNNYDFHRLLNDGITVEVAAPQGGVRGVRISILDTEDIEQNDFVVCSQVRIVDRATGTGQERKPDVVVWINGLPIAVIELKNPRSENADIWGAYNQLQAYKRDIPSLFRTNELLVVSDDVLSRVGSLTAGPSRFQPWRAVNDEKDVRVPAESNAQLAEGERLQALIHGVFDKARLVDLLSNFVTFESDEGRLVKKVAAYHQFHAVRRALDETVRATRSQGDRRVGVVWHTQGSGKSLTMLFYAAKLIREPAMGNPTLVVLTDRNDLDQQLFATFAQAQDLLRQTPIQAASREELRELLNTASGGVYFTTIQKFLPPDGQVAPAISERKNIVVIADEAHRSQYGFKARLDTKKGQIKYGLAKHLRDALPGASFVGFTGTPVELDDKDTVKIFGDYISVYDIRKAVEDGATVPIYYENRLAKIAIDESKRPHIDSEFEEVTEGEEETVKETLKTKWSTLEALVGADGRIKLVAKELVEHFERRNAVMKGGKGMIVCMSRRICADMYEALRDLRPEWCSDRDEEGRVKVVFTGSPSDKGLIAQHVRSKAKLEALAKRFKDPNDPLQLVIVRDMWLTGFDAPCLHTMYLDKPMAGHNLMQAIARVNRVFGDKPGGLVVDYLGLASALKAAMATYTQSGGKGRATEDTDKALETFQERLESCRQIFDGFDYGSFFEGTPQQRLDLLPKAREHVLRLRTAADPNTPKVVDAYDRFLKTVGELSGLAALVATTNDFEAARDEVAFFQAVKAGLVKLSPGRSRPESDLGHAVRQIVANSIVSDEIIDVFSAAGLERPDISVLSEEFLAEIQELPHKNLAAAVLERILRDELKRRRKESVAQVKSFEQKLEEAVNKYLGRSIDAVQVIEHLLEIAAEFRDLGERAKDLGLTREELAFYDVLAENQSAKEVLGDKVLAAMAHELAGLVRKNATIDWTTKRSVQAKLRTLVKRLLRDRGYPPDGQQRATENVLEQAKLLGINVTEGASDGDGDVGEWADEGVPKPPSRPPPPAQPLPYPIAVFDALVDSQSNKALRVKTRFDGIERTLAFLTACELAWLRDDNQGTVPDGAMKLFGKDLGKPISMGTWLAYAVGLAKLLPKDSTDPIVLAGRALLDGKGKPSDVTRRLQDEIVPHRNLFTHGVTPSEEQLLKHEGPVHEVAKQLEAALSPLRETTLVVPVQMLDVDLGTQRFEYEVRRLSGDRNLFPIQKVTVSGKMALRWAHILWRDNSPLSLWPLFTLLNNDDTGLDELYLCRALQFEAKKKVDAMGVASSSVAKIEL